MWEGASQPLLIKCGCDHEGHGDLLGRPEEDWENVRVRRLYGGEMWAIPSFTVPLADH